MKNKNPQFPQAKTENLVIQELPNELLIYDLEKNKAYDLNQTSSLVWQHSDGTKSIREIALLLEKQLKQKVPDELVWLTLEKLRNEGLVSYGKEYFPEFTSLNRRELLKRASLASLVALPVIASLVAPLSTHAASGAAPVPCQACVMKSDGIGECPAVCDQTVLGTCYSNSGCGTGQAVISGVTCTECFSGIYEPETPCNIPEIPGTPNAPGCGTLSWSAPD